MERLPVPHPWYLCTADESQAMDRHTIEDFGIDGYTLMEVAGSRAATDLLERQPQGHGVYVCGKGNNAGDALVVARYLAQHGFTATLVFVSGTGELSSDTSHNFQLLQKLEEQLPDGSIRWIDAWEPEQIDQPFDFIVDGMLGTGLDSNLRGDYTDAVEWINSQEQPVYAIDTPTGLHADTGRILGKAVRADATYSFGALKPGFYVNDGPDCSGEAVYCELPFPNHVKSPHRFLLDDRWVDPLFNQNKPTGRARHKYDAGILYIIAGSEGLTGAAQLAAHSAWAEDIGAVVLICPRGILPVFENNLIHVIKKPVGSHDDNYFKKDHIKDVLSIVSEKPGKVLLGPGLGRASETTGLVHGFLEQYEGDVVIDADALWALAQREWSRPDESRWILTPHPGELAKITGRGFDDAANRIEQVRSWCTENQCTVVSKGYPTVIGTDGEDAYYTGYDTRIFARAGFGDVLAGKIGAFWVQQNNPTLACSKALLHGKQRTDDLSAATGTTYFEPADLI